MLAVAALAPTTLRHSFVTPAQAAEVTYRFGAVGDTGATTATGKVFDAAGTSGLNGFLHLGDMSYSTITPESAWCSFIRSHSGTSLPIELIAGNHEDDGPDGSIGNFGSCLPDSLSAKGTYGKEYYIDYPAVQPLVRFIMISPKMTFPPSSAWSYSAGSSHYNWTSQTIDSARAARIPWVVVGMHHYCVSLVNFPCASGTDIMNLLIAKKVDLYLQAHDHGYSRTKQLALGTGCTAVVAQAYNPKCVANASASSSYSAGAGTVIALVGSGGRSLNSQRPDSPQAPYYQSWMGSNANPTYGFLELSVSATSLSGSFRRASGGTFTDSFTISGSPPVTPPPTSPPVTSPPVTSPPVTTPPATTPPPTSTPPPTTTPPPPTGGTFTLVPVADSWVGSDAPTVNHGSETALYVDGSPAKLTYLRYDLSAVAGNITAATLRVTTTTGSASGSPDRQVVHRVSDTTWTEAGLTYNNRPPPATAELGSVSSTTSNSTYDISLTPAGLAAVAGGRLSLAVDSTGGDAFYVTSRETATPPRLILTTN
jgi:hypothetical protein